MNHIPAAARSTAVTTALLLLALLAAPTAAPADTSYSLTRHTIDGGGTTSSTGGSFSLGGTIGQPDAGTMSGADFVLNGGFWGGGGNTVTAVGDDPTVPDSGLPTVYRLYPGAPNPFNPRTQVAFDLPQGGPVRLCVYDLRGARVRTLIETVLPAGHHFAKWNGTDQAGAQVASGVYVFAIDAGGFHARQKGLLLK